MDAPISAILDEYDLARSRLDAFRGTCQQLIESLLKTEGQRTHSIASRTKGRANLADKLSRLGKTYTSLVDVTDLVGIRIITYFEDDVDRIGAIIKREFMIDERSIDKRETLDPDQFGYLSLHYICGLNEERLRLTEHKHCAGLLAEVQVRTILQHAWAEIEHDLGYKASAEVARPIRRRFSRVAGLLELADGEFLRLRDDIHQYAGHVREKLADGSGEVKIDEISLGELFERDSLSTEIDRAMAESTGHKAQQADKTVYPFISIMLKFAGLETVDQLKRELVDRRAVILERWRRSADSKRVRDFFWGTWSFDLAVLLLLEQGGTERVVQMLEELKLGSPTDRKQVAKQMDDEFKAARESVEADSSNTTK